MSPDRLKHSRPLPKYWRKRGGTYYFRVPRRVRDQLGGKSEISLGQTLAKAHQAYSRLLGGYEDVYTMAQLCDRYAREVIPDKAPATQASNLHSMGRLRVALNSR